MQVVAIVLVVLALPVVGLAQEADDAAPPQAQNYSALALQAFWGDADANPKLLAGEVPAIRAIESAFAQRYAINIDRAERFYKDLKGDDIRARKRALNGLSLMPASYHDWLRQKVQKESDAPLKADLRQALSRAQATTRAEVQLLELLVELYITHIDLMFEATWGRLKEDPTHPEALYFFSLVPFEVVWQQLEKEALSREEKLRFLLLRVYAGSDLHTKRMLRDYTAREIHDLALATYWPVMIEPLQVDGYFNFFTLVGRVDGREAYRVLRVAVNIRDDRPWKTAPWVELRTWFRWTYLFEIRPAQERRDAAVYAEQFPAMIDHLYWPSDAGVHYWIRHLHPQLIQTSVRLVRGFPLDALLPIYAVSPKELEKWEKGHVYNWARTVVPEEIRDNFKFLPNEFDPPPKLPPDW